MRSSEHSNEPIGVRSVWTTTAVMSSAVELAQVTLDPHVLEALGAVAGFEHVALDAGGDDDVGLERQVHLQRDRARVQVLLGEVAVVVEPLAVGEGHLGAGLSQLGEAEPAADVLADVDDPPVGCELAHRHRTQLLDPAHRRRRGADEVGDAMVLDPDRRPRGPVPPLAALPHVVHLAGDQVRPQDVAGRRSPRRIGAEGEDAAVGEGDVELGEQGGRGAVVVDAAGDAVLSAPPPVAEQRADDVVAGVEVVGDVEGLHLEAGAVGREAGSELLIADPGAVDERLVDAVGGDVQGGLADAAVEVQPGGELVHGPLSFGEVVTLDGCDPVGSPVEDEGVGGCLGGGHVGSGRSRRDRSRSAMVPAPTRLKEAVQVA